MGDCSDKRQLIFVSFLQRKCRRGKWFDCHSLQLEVIHDKIPNGSVVGHVFDDLFCSFGYLRIKQSCYDQRQHKHKYAEHKHPNSVY